MPFGECRFSQPCLPILDRWNFLLRPLPAMEWPENYPQSGKCGRAADRSAVTAFSQARFLSDICIHISDKRNSHCYALARYAGSHFIYDQASLNVLTGKSTRPDYWGVIVALALRKTAPASSRLSAATSIAEARGYYELR